MHKAEVDALANGDNFETVTWLSDREIVEDPAPGWRARQYRVKAVTPTHILQEGLFFLLLQCLHTQDYEFWMHYSVHQV